MASISRGRGRGKQTGSMQSQYPTSTNCLWTLTVAGRRGLCGILLFGCLSYARWHRSPTSLFIMVHVWILLGVAKLRLGFTKNLSFFCNFIFIQSMGSTFCSRVALGIVYLDASRSLLLWFVRFIPTSHIFFASQLLVMLLSIKLRFFPIFLGTTAST